MYVHGPAFSSRIGGRIYGAHSGPDAILSKIPATVMRARPAFQGSRYGLVIPRKPTEALR